MPQNKEERASLVKAYHTMLKLFKEALHEIAHETGPIIHTAIDMAKDRTMLLEELTKEEAEQVAEYLKRDVEETATFLVKVESNFKDALSLDKKYIQESLLEVFSEVADKTKLDMMSFKWGLKEHQMLYKSGEVFGIGTLECSKCKHKEHFYKITQISSCKACGGKEFKRSF